MSEPEYTGKKSKKYLTTPEVAEVVNLAVYLDRPLLVEGEAGCGKTQLAQAVADEKGLELVKIVVKSTTRARDLLYTINSLRRLQESQVREGAIEDAKYTYPYIQLGKLGTVIHTGRRCVVLIDEIDKADIDFANDLLEVLEDYQFDIDELPPEEAKACKKERGFGSTLSISDKSQSPIVIITSNREKQLPEPFLRRCLYVELDFPKTAKQLVEIVRRNDAFPKGKTVTKSVVAAVKRFQKVRENASLSDARKPPSTSELIDWIRILHWRGKLDDDGDGDLLPPYWETLFKTKKDLKAYRAQVDRLANAGRAKR